MDFRTLDEYKAIIDNALYTGSWVIFMSHLRNSYNDGYYFDDSIKERIIEACRYAKDNGMKIVNVSNGYEAVRDTLVQ